MYENEIQQIFNLTFFTFQLLQINFFLQDGNYVCLFNAWLVIIALIFCQFINQRKYSFLSKMCILIIKHVFNKRYCYSLKI